MKTTMLVLFVLATLNVEAAFYRWDLSEPASIPAGATYTTTVNSGTPSGVDVTTPTGPLASSAFMDGAIDNWDDANAPIAVRGSTAQNTTWIADLGELLDIDHFVMYSSTGNGWWGQLGSTVSVSDNNIDWTDVGTTTLTYSWQQLPVHQITATDMTVLDEIRYIRIHTSNDKYRNGMKLDELHVFLVPEPSAGLILVAGASMLSLKRRRHSGANRSVSSGSKA